MDKGYHLYADTDPHFYDHPAADTGQTRYAAADRPAPPGWRRQEGRVWVHLVPEDAELPAQGWKIHVSVEAALAAETIDLVSAYCVGARVQHKFLPGPWLYRLNNGKYARRGSSGKLLTLYPTDDQHFARLLADLDPLLAGRPGPYILGDLRWREGPLYVRYGGFRELWCTTDTGERVLAVRDPDGALVPDQRDPYFRVPAWVTPPAPVAAQQRADEAAARSQTLPYTVREALHFSNGGGIYLARDPRTANQLVLREARPFAGIDSTGADAVTRLRSEAAVLRALEGLDCVPAILDEFTVWEHSYLAEEYIEGETMRQFLARNNPMLRPDAEPAAVAEYTTRALDIIDQLQRAVDEIHARGYAFGDLHPANVLVQPDGRVRLVDFEVACRTDDPVPGMGCPGFIAAHADTAAARDRFALDCLRMFVFLPLTMMLDLDPAKVDQLTEALGDLFPVPPEYTENLRTSLRRPAAAARVAAPAHQVSTPGSIDQQCSALARAITASATPHREDRLFPGDPSGLHDGGYTLVNGAAGVLYALAATGHPVDPEHTEWLWQATRRATDPRPGLYTGLHGAALALHHLGRPQEAWEVLGKAIGSTGRDTPATLEGGLAGAGLTLRHILRDTGDGGLRDELAATAERLADALDAPRPPQGRPGLMDGPSGIAEFFLQLYQDERDPTHLDLAARALRLDLQHCRTSEEGAVNLLDGSRLLPYIKGSAGVGLVLQQYLRHHQDEEFAAALSGILLAARARVVVFSGLLNGRAGLMALLAAQRTGPEAARALSRHARLLSWHAVPYQDGTAFPGDQLYRLSMDLGTGTAGVLLALHAAAGGELTIPGLRGPAPTVTPAEINQS